MSFKYSWFAFLLLVPIIGKAQEFPMRHYTMRDGLLHSTVYRIYQDRQGFIWFCSDYGISKFNGKNFVNYTKENGLSDKTVLSVFEDEQGRKLASTYKGGITIITDTSVNKWTIRNAHIPDKVAYAIPDGSKTWIMYFEKGSRLAVVENDSITDIQIINEGKPANVYNIYKTRDGLLVCTGVGVYHVNKSKKYRPYLSEYFSGTHVTDIAFDKSGGIWVGAFEKTVHISSKGIVKSYGYIGSTSDILTDNKGNTWIATDNGELFLVKDGVMENVTDKLQMTNIVITDIFEDHEGNIWLATQGLGVFMITSLDIVHFLARSNNINMYCNTIEKISPEEIWTGSFGTISSLKNGKMSVIKSSLRPSEFVYFIRKDNDHVYIGTPRRLIRKSIHPPYNEEDIIAPTGAISYGRDDKTILIGAFDKLYRLHNNKLFDFDSTGFLDNRRTQWVTYDNEGTLWISTDTGTVTYKKNHFSYASVPGFNYPFKTGRMLLDGHNRMWFSTENGLICKSGDSYKIFTKKDGLISNECRELFEDSQNQLWVSTYRGINIVDLSTLKIREFVVDMDITEIVSIYKHNNYLLIGTVDGLSVVNTDMTMSKAANLPVYITSVTTANGNLISMPSAICLPYKDNKLLIEFAGISYRYPNRVEYRYKMQGLDNGWHTTKSSNLEMSSLPNGSFKFILSARIDHGDWSKPIVFPITIATPIYKKWWFIGSLAFLLVTGAYVAVRKITRRSEAKKREKLIMLNKVTYSKQQALSALINPHFIFNCMNSIQHFMNARDHEMANAYLADFASLIRMTLENAQEVFITVEKEIRRLQLYLSLEQLRIGDKLRFSITIDPRLNTSAVFIPNMILQPFVENAIWHGIIPKKTGGEVNVIFLSDNPDCLKIIIKDNGIGINANKGLKHTHQSYGLKLITERLKLLGKLMDEQYSINIRPLIVDGSEKGTVVEIVISSVRDISKITNLEKELNAHYKGS